MLAKEQQRTLWMAAALIAGTLLLYWPAAGFDFVSFDDGVYVVNNDHLNQGFSRAGLAWCFQAGYASNWHPLTWMSHMLDCQLFGLRSGPPHVVNILLHAADSVLLFLVLKRLTGAYWRSGMVAALFAWHPLHVESVAWVSERKDVLSALFWMLTLLAYVRYADGLRLQNLKAKFYLRLALLFFALGLMAKPMLVTLPCVLLLLDWWPLQRMGPIPLKHFSQLLAEKASFFLLAACSGVLTLLAQSMNDSVASLKFISLSMRLWNGAVGYLRYLEKMFWPAHLSVIYPLVFKLPGLEVVLGVGCLAGISAMAVISRKNRPYFLAGWLWYLITLLPVIGLVQVGGQSMADRYSYLPSIGVFIIVCWAATDLTRQWAGRRAFLLLISAVTLTACAFRTRAQLGCWQDTRTLFQNAIAVDPDNYIAHSSYGNYLQSLGQLEPARLECQRAVEIMPAYVLGYTCLSSVLEAQGRTNEAITTLRDGLKIRPDFSDARCELAKLLFDNDRNVEAETELEAGLKIDAADPQLHLYLGHVSAGQKKYDAAEQQFAECVRLAPQDPAGHYQWALALVARHKNLQAINQYRAALQLQPDLANALNNLAWLLCASPDLQLRNGEEAVQLASRACALTLTNDAVKIETLANACAEAGRFDEAIAWAQQAARVALANGQTNVAAQNLDLQKLYQSHRAYYEYN